MDEVVYGARKAGKRTEKAGELGMGEVVFAMRCEKFSEIGGGKGQEWDDGRWEERAGHVRRMELIRRATAPCKLLEPGTIQTFDVLANALTRNKAQLFPTRRRPKLRTLELADVREIESWFQESGISIGSELNADQKTKAMNLLYTWRDLFETDLLRIRRTDLIEHAIVLLNDAKPYHAKIPLYNEQEIKFCQDLIPRMEEAGLIRRCDSAWGARTKFVPKPRADLRPENDKLRMVHNFIPLNSATEKSRYPCPRIEQIVHTIAKKGKSWFFTADAANSYWAIPVRAGDEHKLGFVTPYGMYCYTVMGQGLTGGTHTYSRFRDLVFGNIPEGSDENGGHIPGFATVIGDRGDVAFDGLIDDSYGSADTFDRLYRFLDEEFFPRCEWGPMYLKGPKCHFFDRTLEMVGLETGENGIRPSLRKRKMITEWPTPRSWEDVRAFCYLTPFLRRFIPGRAELVKIMKKGMEVELNEEKEGIGDTGGDPERKEPEEEVDKGNRRQKKAVKKPRKVQGPFIWTSEHECAFQSIKQAIAMNAMAQPDPNQQYHLAVDASKKGIGGALFQLEGIAPHTEASNSVVHRDSERMVMFISFKLEDAETRYSNSEREALAVIRCLAEVRWMVISSAYPILVYTDHEALRVLLTGLDNDAHGRIAKWQERLGEYNFRLIHRAASTHFMGIADGLSRLPTHLMQRAFAEDSDGLRPRPSLFTRAQAVVDIVVRVNSQLAGHWRLGNDLGSRIEPALEGDGKGKEAEWEGTRETGVAAVLGGKSGGYGQIGREGESLEVAAMDMMRRKWKRWIDSGYYGDIVRVKLHGIGARDELDLGQNEWKALDRRAGRYWMVEGREPRLYWKERDGQLALCVLEGEVEKVLRDLHDGHGHFATGITAGRAHGRYFWPTRQRDIARWVASCESCQRMSKNQRCGQLRPIIQFSPMDMIGMDFMGPINPPCEATGAVYILLIVDYFSRFVFGASLRKADQTSTMQVLIERVVPVVGWPKSVYTDNGSHFTGSAIKEMWEDHGVMHFTSAISHPQSVGLSERYVQMIMGRIRLKCIEMGTSKNWGLLLKDALIDINTRCVLIHGYTPSQILLGFNATTSRRPIVGGPPEAMDQDSTNTSLGEETIHVHMDRRDEQNQTASQKLARNQDQQKPKASRGYRQPKAGDLVLVRDIQLAKEKGKKFEPRWSTPRVLERISKSGVSGHVRHLHDPPGRTKRFHLDDLIPYVSRSGLPPSANTATPAIEYSRDALGNIQGNWVVGQRAFDLTDIGNREPTDWEQMGR